MMNLITAKIVIFAKIRNIINIMEFYDCHNRTSFGSPLAPHFPHKTQLQTSGDFSKSTLTDCKFHDLRNKYAQNHYN